MAMPLSVTHEQEVELYRLTARYNGNITKAATELGHVPDTARRWRRRNRELYNEVAKQELDTIRQQTAERHLEVAEKATDLEDTVIARLAKRLQKDNIDARDLTTIARNLATQSGIHTDKASDMLGLKDKANVAVQVNLNLGDMVTDMASKGTKFYDSEGNEIDPAAITSTATEIKE